MTSPPTKLPQLPPLPPRLDDVLEVINRRPSVTSDHGSVSARYEAPSQRGREFPPDQLSVFLFGAANGHVTIRCMVGSSLAGRPNASSDRLEVTLPVDLVRPFLVAVERGTQLLVQHERHAERALAARGELPEGQRNGWSWF